MIISGTIIQVFPPDYTDPKWHNQYQNIVIDTVNGDMTGRIGCKKPYTEQDIGLQGQWECTQDKNEQGAYNKFKKFNPQYPDRTAPQKPQQATSRAPQQSKLAEGIAEGDVRHGLVCSAIQAGQITIGADQDLGIQDLEYSKNYIVTGRAPLPPSKIPKPEITEPPPTGDEEQPY